MIDSGWMNIYLNRDALELKPPSGSESGQLASDWRREIDGPPIDDPTLLRATLVTEGTPPHRSPGCGCGTFLEAIAVVL